MEILPQVVLTKGSKGWECVTRGLLTPTDRRQLQRCLVVGLKEADRKRRMDIRKSVMEKSPVKVVSQGKVDVKESGKCQTSK